MTTIALSYFSDVPMNSDPFCHKCHRKKKATCRCLTSYLFLLFFVFNLFVNDSPAFWRFPTLKYVKTHHVIKYDRSNDIDVP